MIETGSNKDMKNRADENLKLLGKKTEYKSDYAPEVLETFVNRHMENDYFVKFNCRNLHPCVLSQVSRILRRSTSPTFQTSLWLNQNPSSSICSVSEIMEIFMKTA